MGLESIPARWGLLPAWMKAPERAVRPLLAKIETAAEKPMFRAAFRHFRVLVPACGFYEWRAGTPKQPYFIRPPGGEGWFGLGGVMERREGPDGIERSFAILTTAANEAVAPIHERMPVIIAPEDYAAWLDPGVTDPLLIREIAAAWPAARTEVFPVGLAVGNVRSEGAALIEPVAAPA